MREKKSKKSNSPNVTKKPVKASTKSNAPRVPKQPARASINQHKPEAVASANESRPPKVIRILKSAKGAIIGAGALALAVSAILALVPHRGHLRVQFDHVSVSPAAVPLSQFRPVVGKICSSNASRAILLVHVPLCCTRLIPLGEPKHEHGSKDHGDPLFFRYENYLFANDDQIIHNHNRD